MEKSSLKIPQIKDNTMAKIKRTKGQTMICKAEQRKLKFEQHNNVFKSKSP
jgi:hypothetical protein